MSGLWYQGTHYVIFIPGKTLYGKKPYFCFLIKFLILLCLLQLHWFHHFNLFYKVLVMNLKCQEQVFSLFLFIHSLLSTQGTVQSITKRNMWIWMVSYIMILFLFLNFYVTLSFIGSSLHIEWNIKNQLVTLFCCCIDSYVVGALQ